MGILGTGIQEGLLLKPIRYQWAMDLYDQAVANTWFPNEIQLGEDIADFKRMTDEERHAVTFLMSYFNPNELLVNKALAFGVYPYINAAEAHMYLAKQMWEEANHSMSFEYVLETFPIDRTAAYAAHVDIPSMVRKEDFQVKFIKRMTEETLDISTLQGKQDFVRNLVAYNRSEEHTSELQSRENLVCRLLLEKKNLNMSENVTSNVPTNPDRAKPGSSGGVGRKRRTWSSVGRGTSRMNSVSPSASTRPPRRQR